LLYNNNNKNLHNNVYMYSAYKYIYIPPPNPIKKSAAAILVCNSLGNICFVHVLQSLNDSFPAANGIAVPPGSGQRKLDNTNSILQILLMLDGGQSYVCNLIYY